MQATKLPIAGTATQDFTGKITTERGAMSYGARNMPHDLRNAGFKTTVVRGEESYKGTYRACWRIGYAK